MQFGINADTNIVGTNIGRLGLDNGSYVLVVLVYK